MDKKIIISIVVNALITVVVVLNRDYREFAPVLAPAFGIAVVASIVGAVLIATGRKKQGALLVCAGCALFVPVGIIGIRGALPILKEAGAGVWGTMKPWIIEAAVLIPLVVGMAIIAGTDIEQIASTKQTWLVRLKLIIGGSKYRSSVMDDVPDALLKAAGQGDLATCRLLIEKGADAKKIFLPYAVNNLRDPEIFKLVVERGMEINARDEQGDTPLIYATRGVPSYEGQGRLIQNLLDRKADVNARNNEGQNALMTVFIGQAGYSNRMRVHFWERNKEIPLLLLDHGIDINAVDKQGSTALFYAIDNHALIGPAEDSSPEDMGVIQLLIDRKANVNAANKGGITPLRLAQYIPNPAERDRVVDMLRKAGAKR